MARSSLGNEAWAVNYRCAMGARDFNAAVRALSWHMGSVAFVESGWRHKVQIGRRVLAVANNFHGYDRETRHLCLSLASAFSSGYYGGLPNYFAEAVNQLTSPRPRPTRQELQQESARRAEYARERQENRQRHEAQYLDLGAWV